jgi:hypothetical protein
MENIRYLYGASVQGIQNFIFQTNKLREIAGASELVEQICSKAFGKVLGKNDPDTPNMIENDSNWIIGAAGKIIYIFENEESCKEAVKSFAKKVMTMAPGITISQAVVKMEGEYRDYGKASDELEKRLRIQRNRASRSMTLGLMAIRRAPATGLPAIEDTGEDGLIDEASFRKRKHGQTKSLTEKLTGSGVRLSHKEIAYDFEDLTEKGKNNWIAIIHADGNGLGKIVEAVCKDAKDAKIFSGLLNDITKESAQKAFADVEELFNQSEVIPFRPVVLGGDDLTVICRGDLAVKFTKIFLETFEKKSKELSVLNRYDIVQKGLTACAGIVFVKSSYPFHYAVTLAEKLCGRAKKKAKNIDRYLAPSCLMFHKVQDSFVEDFDEIAKRELTPQSKISFEYGPYYCGKHAETFGETCANTVDSLLKNLEKFEGKEGNAVKSHIRQWISLLFDNVEAANQKMKRLRTVNEKARKMIDANYETLNLSDKVSIPYYDMLSLASIMYVETKTEEEEK